MTNRNIATQSGWVSLQGQSVYLRDFAPEDWAAVHSYAADPAVVRYMSWGPNSAEDSMAFITSAVMSAHDQPRLRYDLAVVRKEDDMVIGGAGIYIRSGRNFEAEIGYCLRQDAWGYGYGSEAAQLLVRFGFIDLEMHRIVATCDPQNKASARVLEKAGLLREGYLRSHLHTRSGWRDSLFYAIVDTDAGDRNKRCIYAVPELHPYDQVERQRERFDPLSGKVPAHVTLVFPFDLLVSNNAVAEHLEDVLSNEQAFSINFDSCRIGASGYAYLPVLAGGARLRQIYENINAGVLQAARYQQRFQGVFRPHLTIGRVETPAAIWKATRDMAAVNRGLTGCIQRIVLETILPGGWSKIEHTVQLK